MHRLLAILIGSALLAVPALCYSQLHVYTGCCSSCGTGTSLNQLYDDGLHNDGAAGDAVYGVDITVDQPAGSYLWAVAGSQYGCGSGAYPYCWCTSCLHSPVRLWTTGPGDVIHFTYDPRGIGGWTPSPGIACDHGMPSRGTALQLVMDWGPELYPGTVYAANRYGTLWGRVVTIAQAGRYWYAFSTVDGSILFTQSYNTRCGGGCFSGEEPTSSFTTTVANTDVLFQFDESTGRMRAVVLGVTPVQSRTWGRMKTLYR
jgi:hypothetical protein